MGNTTAEIIAVITPEFNEAEIKKDATKAGKTAKDAIEKEVAKTNVNFKKGRQYVKMKKDLKSAGQSLGAGVKEGVDDLSKDLQGKTGIGLRLAKSFGVFGGIAAVAIGVGMAGFLAQEKLKSDLAEAIKTPIGQLKATKEISKASGISEEEAFKSIVFSQASGLDLGLIQEGFKQTGVVRSEIAEAGGNVTGTRAQIGDISGLSNVDAYSQIISMAQAQPESGRQAFLDELGMGQIADNLGEISVLLGGKTLSGAISEIETPDNLKESLATYDKIREQENKVRAKNILAVQNEIDSTDLETASAIELAKENAQTAKDMNTLKNVTSLNSEALVQSEIALGNLAINAQNLSQNFGGFFGELQTSIFGSEKQKQQLSADKIILSILKDEAKIAELTAKNETGDLGKFGQQSIVDAETRLKRQKFKLDLLSKKGNPFASRKTEGTFNDQMPASFYGINFSQGGN